MSKHVKVLCQSFLAVGACASMELAAHQADDFVVRVGAAYVMPNDDSSEVSTLAGSEVEVEKSLSLGLSMSYLLHDYVGIGLLGSYPFKHELDGDGSINGLGRIATVRHLPPTLSLQVFPMPHHTWFQPYFGAGLNYTFFFDENASGSLETALGGSTSIELDDSFGLALEAGIDFILSEHWMANICFWYTDISTEATLKTGATKRKVDVDINPFVAKIGIGYRF